MNLAFIMFLMDLFKRMGALPNEEKTANPVKPKLYANHRFNDDAFELIKLTELAGKPLKNKAYYDNQWTIGYGTSTIYNENGKMLRAVVSSDTLETFKKMFNKTNYSDHQIAKYLVFNYANRTNGFPVIAKVLDNTSVPYDYELANALYDFSYNSGGAYSSGFLTGKNPKALYTNQNFANELKLAGNDKKKKAVAYLKLRSEYVRASVSARNQLLFARGWRIRWYYVAQFIEGIKNNYSSLQSTYNTVDKIKSLIFSKYLLRV